MSAVWGGTSLWDPLFRMPLSCCPDLNSARRPAGGTFPEIEAQGWQGLCPGGACLHQGQRPHGPRAGSPCYSGLPACLLTEVLPGVRLSSERDLSPTCSADPGVSPHCTPALARACGRGTQLSWSAGSHCRARTGLPATGQRHRARKPVPSHPSRNAVPHSVLCVLFPGGRGGLY